MRVQFQLNRTIRQHWPAELSVERVKLRVGKGGHHVPTTKIHQRRKRSLQQLPWFLKNADLAWKFDNSGAKPAQIAQSMGVTQDNDSGAGKPLDQFASFTLGTNLITPIEMASAYATLAAQGTYCEPYVITSVTDVQTSSGFPVVGNTYNLVEYVTYGF